MAKKPCVALVDYNTQTHLSGDCSQFLKCKLTGKKCIARVIEINEKETSQFFERGNARFDKVKALRCPLFNKQYLIPKIMSNEV